VKRVAPRAGAGRVLALDTSTEEAVVAVGDGNGTSIAEERWQAGHLHGERLLGSVERVLDAAGTTLDRLTAIVVGLGPGSFTGLRVGLAAAKGLAFGLGIPVVGIATPLALGAAAVGEEDGGAGSALTVVLLPAGPNGRYRTLVERDAREVVRLAGPPAFEPAETDRAIPPGARALALDLPEAPAAARAAGERARRRLGEALLRLGTERLASAGPDDLAVLVPVYVTLPRGAVATGGTIAWSRDPR